MHPQTLRIYEARGLITPKRSPKNTRLYSQDDVERLRRIQELTDRARHEPRRRRAGLRARGGDRRACAAGCAASSARPSASQQRAARRSSSACAASFKRELVPYEPPGKALLPRAARATAAACGSASQRPSRYGPRAVRASRTRSHGAVAVLTDRGAPMLEGLDAARPPADPAARAGAHARRCTAAARS